MPESPPTGVSVSARHRSSSTIPPRFSLLDSSPPSARLIPHTPFAHGHSFSPLPPHTSFIRQHLATRRRRAALRGVTMTLQKLSTGSGYEYLTRQVAALDSTEKGSIPLADYYAAKGEAPGRWIGSGGAVHARG